MFLTPLLTTVVFFVGLLIGSVGIGGVLLVPALKFMGGIDLHSAIPACMLSYMVTGSVGAFIYARHGTINWSMAIKVCAGALPGAYLGAYFLPFFRADVLEVLHPLVESEQVEVRGRHEIDRIRVGVKETPDLRDILESLLWHQSVLSTSLSWSVS